MSNLQVIRRDEVLPAELSRSPKSTYDGHTARLFWIEDGPEVTTFLCEGVLVQPREWYHAGTTPDGTPTESLLVELPPGRTYLGLISGHSVFDLNGRPWLLARGPLPRGELDAGRYPRVADEET